MTIGVKVEVLIQTKTEEHSLLAQMQQGLCHHAT